PRRYQVKVPDTWPRAPEIPQILKTSPKALLRKSNASAARAFLQLSTRPQTHSCPSSSPKPSTSSASSANSSNANMGPKLAISLLERSFCLLLHKV
ncbi:MAG: hypothetical protein M1823_008752, partial [Watsoniomyces obsoletus]